jgi:hypothetical protein
METNLHAMILAKLDDLWFVVSLLNFHITRKNNHPPSTYHAGSVQYFYFMYFAVVISTFTQVVLFRIQERKYRIWLGGS